MDLEALNTQPILLAELKPAPQIDEISQIIGDVVGKFCDFYIKPAQGGAKGYDVYRVNIEKSPDGSFSLTVGTTYKAFENSYFLERIDQSIVVLSENEKYTFLNLSQGQLIHLVSQIAHLIRFPIIEERIPISTLNNEKVEFRVAQIFDSETEELRQRCYSKISPDWTAGNVSIKGSGYSGLQTITALIHEHYPHAEMPEQLAEKILDEIYISAREYRTNYLELLNRKIQGLPEQYIPYELKNGVPTFVVDIGICFLPDGKYELYLVEASFDGGLSYLERVEPEFTNEFYGHLDNIRTKYVGHS